MLNKKDIDYSVVNGEPGEVMKPTRKEYRMMKTDSKAKRKYKLLKEIYGFYDGYDSNIEHGLEIGKLNYGLAHYGYLRKGKIHCSCWLCSQKTKIRGYSASDLRKFDKLNYGEE